MKTAPGPTLLSYATGFGISIVLTLAAYFLAVQHALPGGALVLAIVVLAIVQFVAQVVFFLHLGRDASKRWNLVAFLFMLMVVGILVLGSLWIMNNLNYHTMSPSQMNHFVEQDEGIQK